MIRVSANNIAAARRGSPLPAVPAVVTAGLVIMLALVAATPVRAESSLPTMRILAPIGAVRGTVAESDAPVVRRPATGAESAEVRSMPRGALRDDASWRRLDLPPPTVR